jgi:hypothetical protein
MTQQVEEISLARYSHANRYGPSGAVYVNNMIEMVQQWIRGEPVFIKFDKQPKREGSIGRLVITNIQDLLHGSVEHKYYHWGASNKSNSAPRKKLPLDPALITKLSISNVPIQGHIVWDGRTNKVKFQDWTEIWLKGRDKDLGTVWKWEKPVPPKIVAYDKLKRELKVGDFISYILYHFDNSGNAAGLYYGKITQIENDGTVHAKNIKLKEDDLVDERRIKDNSLIVLMTKDLMDRLMLARLSIL